MEDETNTLLITQKQFNKLHSIQDICNEENVYEK